MNTTPHQQKTMDVTNPTALNVSIGDACYPASNPVLLTSTINQKNQLELIFNGHILQSTDKIYVDSPLNDIDMRIMPPSSRYTLSGSAVESGPTPSPQWLPVQGGSIVADFQAPANPKDPPFTWKFTITATPNDPSLPTPDPADPIMIIKKIRRSG